MTALYFKKWGWIYRPINLTGWLITVLGLVFCLQVFMAVDRKSHSTSDTLYGIFPFVVPAFLVWELIARKTSGEKS